MSLSIKKIELFKIHNRYNLSINLDEGLNVIHGKNGAGKTTFIHIIANIVNCDFVRFAFLNFEEVIATYNNGTRICIRRFIADSKSIIKVVHETGDEIEFSVSEAVDSLREVESDRYARELKPKLLLIIDDFVKRNDLKKTSCSYFPAFRTMLEAWNTYPDNDFERRHYRSGIVQKKVNNFARNLFGKFLPSINYPSPIDIEDRIKDEIRNAQVSIGRYEGKIFSESFVKVFSALIEQNSIDEIKPNEVLSEIQRLAKPQDKALQIDYYEEYSKINDEIRTLVSSGAKGDVGNSVAGALVVYRDALKARQEFQISSFAQINKYFSSVNSFLEDKTLKYDFDMERRNPKVGLKFPDGTWSSIRVMSSGERQLLTMLYATSKMSTDAIVLIDEPELSLHIDWQEDLLKNMLSQLGGRQIIVCTHSPSIATGYEHCMKAIDPLFVSSMSEEGEIDFDEDDSI